MYKTEEYLEPPFQFALPGSEDSEIALYETYWLDKYIYIYIDYIIILL